jgi:hypothetical protein
MPMFRFRPPLLVSLLAVAAVQAGCLNSCDQLCNENARYVDGCLEHWEALWPDMGYDGRRDAPGPAGEAVGSQYEGGPAAEYIEKCKSRYDAAMYFSGPEGAREVRLGCSDDLQLLAGAVGCEDYQPNDVEVDPTENDNGVAPRPDASGG